MNPIDAVNEARKLLKGSSASFSSTNAQGVAILAAALLILDMGDQIIKRLLSIERILERKK